MVVSPYIISPHFIYHLGHYRNFFCFLEPEPVGLLCAFGMALANLTKLIILQTLLFLVCALVYRRIITQHAEVTVSDNTVMATVGKAFDVGDVKVVFGVKIERNPSQSKLDHLGVPSWPKWSCGPSKFPWTFTATETMYLLEGKVKVYCDGHDEFFEIGAGDLVQFPKGMIINWDVIESVNKHYYLEK